MRKFEVSPGTQVDDGAATENTGLPWWAWVLIIAATSVPAIGFMSAFAVYGVSRYVTNAKVAEGRLGLGRLTAGMVRCAAEPGPHGTPRGLPSSSNPVPRELSSVSARKYQSAPTDWTSEAAFACAGFAWSEPQYFVYRWQFVSSTSGLATAVADLDGDGIADHAMEQSVTCPAPEACSVQPLVER